MTPGDIGETALLGFLALAAIRETRDAIMLISGKWRISTAGKPKAPKEPERAAVPFGDLMSAPPAERPSLRGAEKVA